MFANHGMEDGQRKDYNNKLTQRFGSKLCSVMQKQRRESWEKI